MNRETRAVKTAMTRMAEALYPAVQIETAAGVWYVTLPYGDDDGPTTKTGLNALALVADMAMRLRGAEAQSVRDHVRWIGAIDGRGLAAWEAGALRWLHLNPRDAEATDA